MLIITDLNCTKEFLDKKDNFISYKNKVLCFQDVHIARCFSAKTTLEYWRGYHIPAQIMGTC